MLEQIPEAELIDSPDQNSTRRGLLIAAGALAVAGITGQARAQGAPSGMGRNLARYWTSTTNRLVRRITYGINSAEAMSAAQLGFQGYLDQQLNWASIDDSACDDTVSTKWSLTKSTTAQLALLGDSYPLRDAYVHETIYRAVNSKRQLRERMFEFWFDHFNVFNTKVTSYMFLPYLRDVIRANCMSNFGQILNAVANSGAMMQYLDNWVNSGSNPNINYARELLELHTLGVDNGYSQADLYAVAKVMSGWSVQSDPNQSGYGTFNYRSDYHVLGDKVVMGTTIRSGQKDEGDTLLTFLANHPNTATYICTKLCKYFLDYQPSASQVANAVAAWKNSGGDVVSVLRAILTLANLKIARPKLKRPFHYCVSVLRACPPDLSSVEWGEVETICAGAGQGLFQWETPDGYPDRYEYWGPSMGHTINFALGYPTFATPNLYTQAENQFSFAGATGNDVTTALSTGLFGNEMSLSDRKAIYRYLARTINTNMIRCATSLCLASPSFIWF